MLGQGFSASALLTSGAGGPSDEGRPGPCGVWSSFPGLHPPGARSSPSPVVKTKNVRRHCQVSPGGTVTVFERYYIQLKFPGDSISHAWSQLVA